jgi:hypothetical protein|tara:strand:- start:929 stop:1720 length:792 start_codon:yes stop_codon:yes gene_type:complete
MKIAFIGDSYCANIKPGGWPFIVAKEFNADIIAQGLNGRALFHSYEVLLEVVDQADYIIFCITEPNRLPNKDKKDINIANSWDLDDYPIDCSDKMYEAIKGYYNHIISFDWHKVAQKGLLMQIDELMLQKKKNCIWFPCFFNSMEGSDIKSGPVSNRSLFDIEMGMLKTKGMSDKDIETLITFDSYRDSGRRDVFKKWLFNKKSNFKTRQNHLNEEHNQIMANLIIDIIKKGNFISREIKMEDYFESLRYKYSKEEHSPFIYD